jgi:hypothetical protein
MRRIARAIRPASAVFVVSMLVAGTQPVLAEGTDLLLGRGLFCATAEEVENAIRTVDDQGLASVNGLYDEHSFGFATALFQSSNDARTVPTHNGMVHVTKVEIVGYLEGDELAIVHRPIAKYFAAFDLPHPNA